MQLIRVSRSKAMRARAKAMLPDLGEELIHLRREELRLREAWHADEQADLVQHMPAIREVAS